MPIFLRLVVALCLTSIFVQVPEAVAATPAQERVQLQNEKLREEVRMLKHQNGRWSRLVEGVPPYGALVTALVAVGGILLAFRAQLGERRQERERRTDEGARHLEERFEHVVAALGDPDVGPRASAAVSIRSFLQPEYAVYRDRVLDIVIANLKILGKTPEERERIINELLAHTLELALRSLADGGASLDGLDLARTSLRRVDLSGLSLARLDLAYTDLTGANLVGTNLFRATGIEVCLDNVRCDKETNLEEARLKGASGDRARFHKARLISVHLEEAHLEGAEFFDARMNTAHFEGAVLTGAKFDGANVIEAVFRGATFDEPALKSMKKAQNLDRAHFDPDVAERLGLTLA